MDVATSIVSPAGPLSRQARTLRLLHTSIGLGELCCLGYLWFCALSGRRDRWLKLSAGVLAGEGVALLMAKGCPLGVFQRRAGDDVPMFELWFGPRLAPYAIPSFTMIAVMGLLLVLGRPPGADSETRGKRRLFASCLKPCVNRDRSDTAWTLARAS